MTKKQKSIQIVFLVLSGLIAGALLCLAGLDPPRDRAAGKDYPAEFFCENSANPMDLQTEGSCASYAAAYVLRDLGEQTDGEKIAAEMRRVWGFVPAQSIVEVLENHGFSAKAYHGDADTLKEQLSKGVPVIVFVSIPGDTHYAVVVGYDRRNFYLVDSLPENQNADGGRYNRKLTAAEFERIWRTHTMLSDNIYIAAGGNVDR